MHYNELQRLSVKYVFEFMPALKSEVIGINLRSTLCRKGFQLLIQVWLSQCKGMLSYLMKICVIYVKFSSFELIHISTLNMSILNMSDTWRAKALSILQSNHFSAAVKWWCLSLVWFIIIWTIWASIYTYILICSHR